MMAYLTQQLKPYRYDDYAPHEEFEDVNRYWYQAKGGSWVCIPKLINPYDNLNVRKGASIGECKTAFRELVSTPNRQKRMLVAYSWHMITNEALYRIGERTVCDVFDYAISGNTGNLKLELEKHPDALECTDTSGSSLLYIAARSGFYDTCEFLLDKGAKPGLACGSSESTPLHAASYYGHDLVCMLLISRGAKVDAKNKFGNTPADEAKTHELNQKLQVLKNGDKPSPMARLTGSLCLENVTHNGKTVARLLRLQNIEIPKNWLPAWHGTKYNYLNSILKNGLQPSGAVVDGTAIRPPKGHYQLGSTHFGVNNWASAVFISPSLIYAGHPTYSERVVIDGEQWCVIVCVLCRPGSFGSYPSTIVSNDPVDGEPVDSEWRINVDGDNLIWRMEQGSKSSSLMVTGAVLVDIKFFDSIGSIGGLTYREASLLVHTNYSQK